MVIVVIQQSYTVFWAKAISSYVHFKIAVRTFIIITGDGYFDPQSAAARV